MIENESTESSDAQKKFSSMTMYRILRGKAPLLNCAHPNFVTQ